MIQKKCSWEQLIQVKATVDDAFFKLLFCVGFPNNGVSRSVPFAAAMRTDSGKGLAGAVPIPSQSNMTVPGMPMNNGSGLPMNPAGGMPMAPPGMVWAFNAQLGQFCWMSMGGGGGSGGSPYYHSAYGMPPHPGQHGGGMLPVGGSAAPGTFLYPFMPGVYGGNVRTSQNPVMLRGPAIVQRPPMPAPGNKVALAPLAAHGGRYAGNMLGMTAPKQTKGGARAAQRRARRREEEGVTDEEEEEEEEAELSDSGSEEDGDGGLVLQVASDEEDAVVQIRRPVGEGPNETRQRPKRESLRRVDYASLEKTQDALLGDPAAGLVAVRPREPGQPRVQRRPSTAPTGGTGQEAAAKPRRAQAAAMDGLVAYDSDALEDADGEGDNEGAFVERILGAREFTYEEALQRNAVQLLLVKPAHRSFLHVEWVTRELVLAERGGHIRLSRFLKRWRAHPETHGSLLGHAAKQHDEALFDPLYILVDRVLHHEGPLPSGGPAHVYVKWAGLPLEAATWEFAADVRSLEAVDGSSGADKLASYLANLAPSQTKVLAARAFSERRAAVQRAAGPDKILSLSMLALMVGNAAPRPPYLPLTASPSYKHGNVLRPYQLEGLNWLLFCWANRQPCIIADEMGLGKTVQSVAFLERLHSQHALPGPFLVVAPLSTLPHWQREFDAWTDLKVTII
jgi:hypothetical protein